MIAKVVTYALTYSLLVATPAARTQAPEQSRTATVRVDAQVIGKKSNGFVSGLKKEDFSIYEDGSEQKITRFSQNQGPLSIVLLVDSSGSMRRIMQAVIESLSQALTRMQPEDEVALMSFKDDTTLLQDFTRNKNLIADKLSRIVASRPTLLNEALYQAAAQLSKAPGANNRHLVIVVTDNLLREPAGSRSEREVFERIQASGGVICGLITGDSYTRSSPRYPQIQSVPTAEKGDIKTYAEKTGGIVTTVEKINEKEVAAGLAKMTDALRNYYSFEYVSSSPKQDGKYRRIKLKLSSDVEKREDKLKIVTAEGYYAPGANQPAKQ